jgi:hypothetical protein
MVKLRGPSGPLEGFTLRQRSEARSHYGLDGRCMNTSSARALISIDGTGFHPLAAQLTEALQRVSSETGSAPNWRGLGGSTLLECGQDSDYIYGGCLNARSVA